MARKCASAAILETLRDPRVVTMAPAAQTVWIRIVTAMQNSGISVLKFGSDIMNQTGIALFIQVAETELETHLQTILDRGLLSRDSDGSLVCPMLVAATSRSEINKINGSKGGRPRKDGSPPAQRSLILPIDGGATETKKTETLTKPATEAAETPTYLLTKSSNEVKVSSVSDTEFHEIGRAALGQAGFDPARSMATYGIVRQWLADGADREMILDVIAAKTKPSVTTLNYFNAAIREAIAAKPPEKQPWQREYDKAMAVWDVAGRGFSPMPRIEQFRERAVA